MTRATSPILSLVDCLCFLCNAHIHICTPWDCLGQWCCCCPSSLGKGSHKLGDLLFQFGCSPNQLGCHGSLGPHSILGLLIFALSLVSSHHQLQIHHVRGTVQVLNRVTDKLSYPMEKTIPKVPLGIQICHFPGNWSWIWLRVPSSLVANQGTFSLFPRLTLLKFCINMSTVPKMTNNFVGYDQC